MKILLKATCIFVIPIFCSGLRLQTGKILCLWREELFLINNIYIFVWFLWSCEWQRNFIAISPYATRWHLKDFDTSDHDTHIRHHPLADSILQVTINLGYRTKYGGKYLQVCFQQRPPPLTRALKLNPELKYWPFTTPEFLGRQVSTILCAIEPNSPQLRDISLEFW